MIVWVVKEESGWLGSFSAYRRKMTIAAVQLKWNEFRRNLIKGWNKRRNDQFNKVKNVRERSISILQKRYGYTREEATSQLDKHYSRAWLG